MKSNRIFKGMAAITAVLPAGFNGIFSGSREHSHGVTGRVTNGRAEFYGVSAPKCHNQKKHYR